MLVARSHCALRPQKKGRDKEFEHFMVCGQENLKKGKPHLFFSRRGLKPVSPIFLPWQVLFIIKGDILFKINWTFFQPSKWQASGSWEQIQLNITIHNSSYLFLPNNNLCNLQYWDHILKRNFYLNLAELKENKYLLPWMKVQGKHYYRRQCVLPVTGNAKVEMYVLCPP